jgi:uncharacterized protein
MDVDNVKWVSAALVVGLVAFAAYGVVRQSQAIGEGKIVMAAGSEQHNELAESYRKDLERYGVKFEVRRGAEGFATLRELLKEGASLNAAFIKGGLVGSLQGRLASEKQKGRHEEFSKLWSIGRVFYEPIWVFVRPDMPITSLRDLKGKRILTGTRESGTRRIASQLLKANGIEKTDATLIESTLPEDAAPLLDGSADAAFLVDAPDSARIQKLLENMASTKIRLLDFSTEAEAYDNRFPAITTVVLRKGAVDLSPVIPPTDVTLLTTTAVLVARKEMHQTLRSLLAHTVLSHPRSGFDKAGDPVLFHKAGDFPSIVDPEFQVPSEVRAVYKSGEMPVLLRTLLPISARLGLPFSFTSYVSTYGGQALLVLIPLVALVIPFSRTVPALYMWMVRRRLFYWYHQLKALERSLDSDGGKPDEAAQLAELERIDGAVRRIQLPLPFSSELYDLRLHIDLVRQRLSAPLAAVKLAAE